MTPGCWLLIPEPTGGTHGGPPSHAALDGVAPSGREPEPWGSRGHCLVTRDWRNGAGRITRGFLPVPQRMGASQIPEGGSSPSPRQGGSGSKPPAAMMPPARPTKPSAPLEGMGFPKTLYAPVGIARALASSSASRPMIVRSAWRRTRFDPTYAEHRQRVVVLQPSEFAFDSPGIKPGDRGIA